MAGGSRRGQSSSSSFWESFSWAKCSCCVVSVLLVAAMLVGALALVVVLLLRPRRPQLGLEGVRVDSISVSDGNGNGNNVHAQVQVGASMSLLLRASNPNKVGIRYGSSRLLVLYRGIPLGVATTPPLYQAAHANSSVVARVLVSGVSFPAMVARDLATDAAVHDRVPLRLTGDVSTNIRLLGINSPKVQLLGQAYGTCSRTVGSIKIRATYRRSTCHLDPWKKQSYWC